MSRRAEVTWLCIVGAPLCLLACRPEESAPANKSVVVLYASVDEPIARPVLEEFRRRSGLEVSIVFDSEAGKTTGLVNRIRAEAASGRPRGDVFWSGEPFQTIRLARDRLLAQTDVSSADDLPTAFRDPERRWNAFALRARVLAYDGARVSPESLPSRWEALEAPKFASRLAMANPLFGTTQGHVSAMFAAWGPQRARSFLSSVRDAGVLIVDGNSAAVRAVIDGRAEFALTDSDDVWLGKRVLPTLAAAYPDLGDGGTLLVACTAGRIQGGPNAQGARGLLEFLVSVDAERMLALSDARFIPTRESLRRELGVELPRASPAAFQAITDHLDEAANAVREILVR